MFTPGQAQATAADVYSAAEIAKAAGVAVRLIRDRIAAGLIPTVDGTYVAEAAAVEAVRAAALSPAFESGPGATAQPELLAPPPPQRRRTGLPLALSSGLHAAAVAIFVTVSSLGLLSNDTESAVTRPVEPARLVFLMKPGPGGGGGGGGMRQKTTPPKIQIKRPKPAPVSRPIPIRRPPPVMTRAKVDVPPPQPPVRPVMRETPIEMPKPAPAAPAVVAPVVSAPADPQDKAGTLDSTSTGAASTGSGSGGGAGTGSGSGMGEGDGAGIGPGSGGGTGGGPYRAGSGIDPPSLLREVKPQYTDEGRRQGVEGDVLLEIVVRRDGSVGDVKILRRLGAGLDQKAIDAVRQWRFSPARRMGAPVDVVVEVAVEFKLR